MNNSRPRIYVYISGHRHLVEPNAAGKSKISKRLSAIVFKGKGVTEQRCLILKEEAEEEEEGEEEQEVEEGGGGEGEEEEKEEEEDTTKL